MKYGSTGLHEYKWVKVGMHRIEQESKRERIVQCKAIKLGLDGKYYAMWMYILKKTGKVSGKSPVWLTEIKPD